MLAEIKYDLKFLQPHECNTIIEHCKQFPLERSKFGYPPFSFVDTTKRISKFSRIESNDTVLKEIIDKVKDYVKNANEDVFLFDVDYSKVNINFVEYDGNEKGFSTRHQSVNWISDSIQNKLYLMINLSDPTTFEGGENRFSFGNRDELPRRLETRNQGIMMCFPCFRYFETLPVLSGKKYVLEFFFRGPHWK
jgi:hypothetical protein